MSFPFIKQNVRSFLSSENSERELNSSSSSELSTIRCFYECVNQNMSSAQCIQHIKDTIGENLDGHEIPNLQIKVSPPRTPKAISETYWMIGIPVNLYGETHCNINGGNIIYPWDWEISEGISVSIPPVSCIGLDAIACCNKVMLEVGAQVPLVDKNGNCLSCWVHQEPLEPVISSGTGSLAYLEYSSTDGIDCQSMELTPAEVQSVDDEVETQLVNVRNAIDDILIQDPVNCGDFIRLHRDLLFYGRAFPSAMSKISGLLCGICKSESETYTLTTKMIRTLIWIKIRLTGELKSDENCIIIYTDHQDRVMEPPKIGGSRHELDWDRDDPDCEEPPSNPNNPAMAPVQPPNPSGGSCPLPKVESAPGSGVCICPLPYDEDDMGGCNACVDTIGNPSNGCLPSGAGCVAPKIESPAGSGVCVCPPGYTHVYGTCQPDGSNDCIAPKVADRLGNCVCPNGSYQGENDICYVDCTIEDVIEKFGTDGPCGTPYTDCLKEACGDYWSDECKKLLEGDSSVKGSASAWAECLQTDIYTGSDGPPGMTGVSGKSKTTSQASAKSATKSISSGSINAPILSVKTTTFSGKTATTSAKTATTKSMTSSTKSKTQSAGRRRRVVRHLTGTTTAKFGDAKSKDTKATKVSSKASIPTAKSTKTGSMTTATSTKTASMATATSTKTESMATATSTKTASMPTAPSTKTASMPTAPSTKSAPAHLPAPTPIGLPGPPSDCALQCEDIGRKPLVAGPDGSYPLPSSSAKSGSSTKSTGGTTAKSMESTTATSMGGNTAKSMEGTTAKSMGGSSAKSKADSSAKSMVGTSAESVSVYIDEYAEEGTKKSMRGSS